MDRASLTNFDRRVTAAAKALNPGQRTAQERLKKVVPGASVDFEPVLGSPKWVHAGVGLLTGPNGEGGTVSKTTAKQFDRDPDKALKGFLQEQRDLFRHGAEVLAGAVKTRDATNEHGLRTAVWEQRVDGIPVFDSVLIAHTTARGELISVASQFVPDPQKAADRGTPNRVAKARAPTVDAQLALRLAATSVGEDLAEISILDPKPGQKLRGQRFTAKPLPGEASAALVWLPLDGDTLRLCWEVELNRREFSERFRFIVDAETGEVLVRRKLTVEVSEVFYRVYTSDSPSPMSPGVSVPTNTQPPYVPRALLSISNLNPVASPLGWINDGVLETRGNNVDAHLDRDNDDRADLPRAQGSVTNWVEGGVTNSQRIFDFPIDFAQNATTYAPAATVQLFYWCNFMHDKLYELGFQEPFGNFQKDNFGRGGFDNDAMMADAQDGSGFNNANFTPARDGTPGKIQMYIFNSPSPTRDGDLDAEVICHEYTHGLSDRLIGGGVGISALQTMGMGEGWSDFFAEALLSQYEDDLGGNYAMGGYVTYQFSGLTQNYYYGIRRYPYSTNLNVDPLTFKDIDPLRASPHIGIPKSPIISSSGSEVHRQGEVWCSMLWDMRAFLLRKYAPTNATDFTNANMRVLRHVTFGLQLCPPNPSFLQARDAILNAVSRSDRPDDTNEVWQAFARRGLGVSAICPDSSTTFGVIEGYDTPQQPEFSVQPGTIDFSGPVGGPFTNGPKNGPFTTNVATITLSNASGSNLAWSAATVTSDNVRLLTLSRTNGVLAPNTKTEVVASLVPETTTLPRDTYTGTIYFTNLTRTQIVSRALSLTVGETSQPPGDPLVITPPGTLLIHGPNGGPFTPTQSVYQLANTGSEPLPWYAWTTNEWLSVSALSGVLDVPDANNIFVSVTTNANALPNGLYSGAVSVLNTNTSVVQNIPVLLRIGPVDFFMEDFTSKSNDLQFSSLTLTPDGTQNYYSACRKLTSEFPVDPTNGIPLTIGDDEYRQIVLTNDRQVSILGVSSNAIYIGANGNLTFDPGSKTDVFYPDINEFFAHMRVAPFYADLNPAAGGTVSYQELGDRFVVTWQDVPEFGTTNLNNIQTEMFYDGRIRLTWLHTLLTVDPVAFAGLSPGGGLPEDFVQSDLSAYGNCALGALLVLPSSGTEGNALDVTIFLSAPATNDIDVVFSSSDTNEVLLADTTYRIPAGTNSAFFEIGSLVDDGIPDGPQSVTITATFADRPPASAMIQVNDNEDGGNDLFVHVPGIAREGDVLAGAGRVLIADGVVRTKPLTITLSSSDPGHVRVPPRVVIQPGTNAANFDLVFPENDLIEGPRQFQIRYSVPNWSEISASTVTVLDNESSWLNLTLPAEVTEGAGPLTNAGIVAISGIGQSNIVITLQSDQPTIVSVPSSVTNIAGSSNVSFTITVGNNDVTNGFSSVHIIATSFGFTSVTNNISVIDDERPFEPNDPLPENFATHVHRDTTLSWSANSTAPAGTTYLVYFGTNPDLAVDPLIATTTGKSVPVPYELNPDTTYYWQVRATLAGFPSVSSPVWQFRTAGVRYEFGGIASPQFVNEPFPISIVAWDEWGLRVTNHSAQLTLSNYMPIKSSASIVITEVENSGLRTVEFANVSTKSINVAGWKIYLYDSINWPAPAVAFTIPSPSVAAPGDLFLLRNLPLNFFPGTYPNFATGTNVAWNENIDNNPLAVLLVDNVGNFVDFVCASGADPALISVPGAIPAQQWAGPAVLANPDPMLTYQRFGNRDSNNSNDWRTVERSTRTNNLDLAIPFFNAASVGFTATPLQTYRNGVCTGLVTMLEPSPGVVFGITDSEGRGATANPIDVLAHNDLSLNISAPDSAFVGESIPYQFRITNTGPAVASGVRLIDLVSSNAQFASAIPSQGACVVTNGRVECDLGAIDGGASAAVSIMALTSSRGVATNIVTVSRNESDAYLSNNTAVVETTVAYPQVAIFNSTFREGDPARAIAFTVMLSAPSTQTSSVAFATADGTASGGIDYLATNGVVTFAPGTTNQVISVPVFDDSRNESNETFFVNLFSPSNLDITRQVGVGTINDDDALPGLSVTDPTIVEPDIGSTTVKFQVQLSSASGRIVNVNFSTASGTALAGLDFEETYGTLFFPPGVTNLEVAVPVLGDTVAEPTKTFFLNLAGAGNAFIIRGQAACTIIDKDIEAVSSFGFAPILEANHAGLPTPVAITSYDSQGAVATNFNGGVALFATTLARSVEIGTNTTTWSLPLGAAFHDARLQSIYLTNELGTAGTIVGLSLDVTTPPAQILSNFTIRLRHTSKDRYFDAAWESTGWVTNCQRDALIASSGWVYFPFSTPFAYNGRDNLMVDFSFDDSSFSADGLVRSSGTGTPRSLSLRTDSAYGRPLDWPIGTSTTTPAGQLSARVPNVRLLMGDALAFQPLGTNWFTNGVWSGTVTLTNGAENVVLRAVDSTGHFGDSAPFSIVTLKVAAAQDSSSVMLSFPTIAGHQYVVETNSTLAAAGWNAASPVMPGNGAVLQFEHTPAASPQFYRIRLVQ